MAPLRCASTRRAVLCTDSDAAELNVRWWCAPSHSQHNVCRILHELQQLSISHSLELTVQLYGRKRSSMPSAERCCSMRSSSDLGPAHVHTQTHVRVSECVRHIQDQHHKAGQWRPSALLTLPASPLQRRSAAAPCNPARPSTRHPPTEPTVGQVPRHKLEQLALGTKVGAVPLEDHRHLHRPRARLDHHLACTAQHQVHQCGVLLVRQPA